MWPTARQIAAERRRAGLAVHRSHLCQIVDRDVTSLGTGARRWQTVLLHGGTQACAP